MVPLAKKHTSDKSKRWIRKAPTQLAEVLVEYLASANMRDVGPETPLFFDQSVQVSHCLANVFKHVKTYSKRLGGPILYSHIVFVIPSVPAQ